MSTSISSMGMTRALRSNGQATQRPWSWADTVPVGRLEFVRQRRSMIVLEGDAGRTLAFGPGLRTGSAMPGTPGNSVISAHRDTHFAVLRHVVVGDMVRVDADRGVLELRVDADELAARPLAQADLSANQHGMGRELFSGFRRQVSGAEEGAMSFGLTD